MIERDRSGTYAELHCHSYFSLLDGASSPEALVERAAALGYPALALTDHNGLYGAVRFWQAAQARGIQAIIGAEVTLAGEEAGAPSPLEFGSRYEPESGAGDPIDGSHLVLLAETQHGYANLCRLLSAGQLAGQKGQPRLSLGTLAAHAGGLIGLSGCEQGAVPRALLAGDEIAAQQIAGRLREILGPDRFWIELQRHYRPADARRVAELNALAQWLGAGVVATNNVHYATRAGRPLHDVLTCVRHHTTLPEALGGGLLHPNSERFLKPAWEMATLFAGRRAHPGARPPIAVRNSLRIAERCQVCLDFTAQRLPIFPVPDKHTPDSYLHHLCETALPRHFDPVGDPARAQLAHELGVIERLGLASYFLVVWDIVRFAREQGIRCQGRGSAANSLVAYLLGITPVDPLRHNLLFERFLSEGAGPAKDDRTGPVKSDRTGPAKSDRTGTMPDIDVDFAADRREEVIQYVYQRYGEEHVGMVCNVVTYRARSALRDAAKALVFPSDVIDRTAKALDTRSTATVAESIEQAAAGAASQSSVPGFEDAIPLPWQTLARLLRQMDGLPRHLSIHVGGMLITAAPLIEVVPLERATMPGRVVVQWDKDSVEDAGLIKIDLLSLRTLGAVEEAVQWMRSEYGCNLPAASPSGQALDDLPLDDPAVFRLLQRADTVGCFQVESRAQAQMLPKLQPARFEDIVVGVALIRPGPIQGGMVHPYLKRRQGIEPVVYPHPALEAALGETLGVIVFQEQVLRVAMAIAGFRPTEADQLRRAMSRSRSEAAMAALQARFLAGAQANGVSPETAAEVWKQLEGFAGFGFCKSHAAAFALVAYQTLYLKAHYPAAFFCALLNHQPLGFYPPEVLTGDAQRHGAPVLGPDVNRSLANCTLERVDGGQQWAIRLGLRYVHGLGEAWQTRIVERRGDCPFRDLRDLCQRTRLPRPVVDNLIRAGAMDGWSQRRRDLLWELGGLFYQEDGLDVEAAVEVVDLPRLSRAERMAWEYELLGLAPGAQVMDLYRETLQARGMISSGVLATRQDGELVRVAGWAVVRQRPPTAKGHLFVTLEDEEGLMNLIVRPQVYERYRETLRNAPLLWVEGRVQRAEDALSVLVRRAGRLRGPE